MKKIKRIKKKKNGDGNALIEGIKATKTKYCCIINADGSMKPKYLKRMLALCEKKDLVFTSRYQKPGGGSEDDDVVTSIGNFFFTFFGRLEKVFNCTFSNYTKDLAKADEKKWFSNPDSSIVKDRDNTYYGLEKLQKIVSLPG